MLQIMGSGGGGVKGKKVPPDGGWGWFVVLGCSLINVSPRSKNTSFLIPNFMFLFILDECGVDFSVSVFRFPQSYQGNILK